MRRIRPPRRGLKLPPPILVADSWFGDSKLMGHVATAHEGILLVEGKSTYVFALPDGVRSRAMTCRRTAIGPGVTARRYQECVMCGCGPPVQRMAR